MATTDPTPTNLTIGTAGTPIPGPCAPEDFRTSANSYTLKQQTSAQALCGFLEMLQNAIGNGAISGGTITAGVGLSVSVAALTAFVGTYVNVTASTTVGSLANGSLNYLYLYQDGTFTSNTTGTTPSSSGGHGQAFLWGTVTTAGGAIASISNIRRTFAQNISVIPLVTADPDSPVSGDAWFRTDTEQLVIQGGGTIGASDSDLSALDDAVEDVADAQDRLDVLERKYRSLVFAVGLLFGDDVLVSDELRDDFLLAAGEG